MMSWFSKKPVVKPRIKTEIGTFVFQGAAWMTEPADGSIIFLSSNDELDIDAIEAAKMLLPDVDGYNAAAVNYAQRCGADLWDGKANLMLEAIDITDITKKKFGLTFGVDGQPDFTITVEFRNGQPFDVWGAD